MHSPNFNQVDKHWELHAFHCLPPCFQAAKPGSSGTSTTLSTLTTGVPSAGDGRPVVNITLFDLSIYSHLSDNQSFDLPPQKDLQCPPLNVCSMCYLLKQMFLPFVHNLVNGNLRCQQEYKLCECQVTPSNIILDFTQKPKLASLSQFSQ